MNRIFSNMSQGLRRWQIVAQATHGVSPAASSIGPDSQKVDKEVSGKLDGQHLWDNVEVRDQSGL